MSDTVVTPEFFERLVADLDRPPKTPNPELAALLRRTRGTVVHR